MNRRFQFSLKAALVVMAVAPFIAYCVVQSRRAEQACQEFEAANVRFSMGAATFEDVYDRSCSLRDAEIAVPFTSRRATRIRYVNRLAALESRLHAMLLFALPGADNATDDCKKKLKALRDERANLERELGTKAANTDLN